MQATAANAGDMRWIPESGSFTGEENGNPLQYLCLRNPMDRGACRFTVYRVERVGHDLMTNHHHHKVCIEC